MTVQPSKVAVIGGGVSGLRTARLLRDAGVDVVVLEGSSRIGGQIRTVEVAGVPVDIGAEAMHLGAPGAAAFIESLGLTESMITARSGQSWIVTPRGLRRLPAGVGPAGPTRLRPVLSSRVMTVPGLVRAGLEPVLARRAGGAGLTPGRDVSVGDFVGSRFGSQVVDRFVDPLLGSLHAGDVRRLSLRACAPSLVPAANDGRSLITRRRPSPPPTSAPAASASAGPPRVAPAKAAPPAMSFVSWRDGLTRVVDALADGLDIRTNSPVEALERTDGGYRLTVGARDRAEGDGPDRPGERVDVDAVVLAVSNDVAGPLLRGVAATAADRLAETDRASVATLVLAYPRHIVEALPAFRGTGVLVPSSTGSLLKAATFLSTKWPHLDHPDHVFCRLSAGRAGDHRLAGLDDQELLTRMRADLREVIGLDVAPRHVHVQRWPAAMPQLTVGHPDRIADARADLAPGLALAGSSYDGVGLSSCIASAERAATAVLAHLRVDTPGGPR